VIVACDHGGRTELATRVSGVETAGRVPGSLAAALQTGSPCAEVSSLLARVTTVLLRCEYVVADGLVTPVAGSEIAGAVDVSLAAALPTRPSSCAGAYAAVSGAGFGLVSPGPAPAAGDVDASDVVIWRRHYGSTL